MYLTLLNYTVKMVKIIKLYINKLYITSTLSQLKILIKK